MSLSRKLKRLHDKKERAEEGTKKIKRKVPEFLEPHLLLTDVQLEGIVRFQKVLDRSGMELRGGFASLIH